MSGSQEQECQDILLIDEGVRLVGMEFHINSREIFCILLYNFCTSVFRWAYYYFIYYLYCSCCCRRFYNYKDTIFSCFFNQMLSFILFSIELLLIYYMLLTFCWAFADLLCADF